MGFKEAKGAVWSFHPQHQIADFHTLKIDADHAGVVTQATNAIGCRQGIGRLGLALDRFQTLDSGLGFRDFQGRCATRFLQSFHRGHAPDEECWTIGAQKRRPVRRRHRNAGPGGGRTESGEGEPNDQSFGFQKLGHSR